jgi:ribosomal protein L16 Arg81 hydroxylase
MTHVADSIHDADSPEIAASNWTAVQELENILAPVPVTEFLMQYWSSRLLFVSGTPAKFDSLFSWACLNEILATHRLPHSRLRLVKNGEAIDPSFYQYPSVVPSGGVNITDDDRLTAHLRSGASLVLNEAEDLHLPLRRFATGLQHIFTAHVNINLYAGFKHDPGFLVHWDPQDGFILQVAGTKSWRVWLPSRAWPIKADRDRLEEPKGEPIWSGDLKAGDLLYIPRGWWHVATPLDQPSLHLTVTTNARSGLDLLRWLVGRVASYDVARMSVPTAYPASERLRYYDELRSALLSTANSTDWDLFLESERQSPDLRPRPRFSLPHI